MDLSALISVLRAPRGWVDQQKRLGGGVPDPYTLFSNLYPSKEAIDEIERWTKGDSPLDGPGRGLFKEDRFLPAVEAVASVPGPGTAKKALEAALYAGALRKDLIASTAVKPQVLIDSGKLTSELTNPSLAITKGDVSRFDDNPVALIAREGVFDPRTSNTSLHAFDAYTPRRGQTAARHPLTYESERQMYEMQYEKHPELLAVALRNLRQDEANRRLVDRFISTFEKGGRQAESAGKPKVVTLPHYGMGGYDVPLKQIVPAVPGKMGESYGPRFQSFKHYERSPYGAARLDSGPSADSVYDEIDKAFGEFGEDALDRMWIAAQGRKGEAEMRKAYELYDKLKRTKSDYAEIKAFGPVGLHSGNFPGAIITRPQASSTTWLAEALRKRGIPVETAKDAKEAFDIASWMAEGGAPASINRTLPRKKVVAEPVTKLPVGEATELTVSKHPLAQQWADELTDGATTLSFEDWLIDNSDLLAKHGIEDVPF